MSGQSTITAKSHFSAIIAHFWPELPQRVYSVRERLMAMKSLIAVLAALAMAVAPVAAMEADATPDEGIELAREGYAAAKETTGAEESLPDELEAAVEQAVGVEEGDEAPPNQDVDGGTTPGFAHRVRDAVDGPMMVAGLAGLGATAIGMIGFAAVTRYISPKEALKNPQRAMLYGFIRATPGAHLKQLSEEFKMKTSSILWHIRKLESADLVLSERANGFRVFYPTEGGIEAKRLSRAITALHNPNAQAIQEAVGRTPGRAVKEISDALSVHSGTVRWHLRKLRDFGLMEELVGEEGSRFYPTPLGKNAIDAAVGKPTVAPPSPMAASRAVIGGE
jgi:DNA-binding transcriptional ArsR family regulator